MAENDSTKVDEGAKTPDESSRAMKILAGTVLTALFVVPLAVSVALIYVVVHFIVKFW